MPTHAPPAGRPVRRLNTGVRYVEDARARGAATLLPDDQQAAWPTLASLEPLRRAASSPSWARPARPRRRTSSARSAPPSSRRSLPKQSQNNEIGLPLTVLRLEPETEVLVVEMGMRGLGQIAELAARSRGPTSCSSPKSGPSTSSSSARWRTSRGRTRRRSTRYRRVGSRSSRRPRLELEPYLRDVLDVRAFDPLDVDRVRPGLAIPRGGSRAAPSPPPSPSATTPRTRWRRSPPTRHSASRSTAPGGGSRLLSRWRGRGASVARRRLRRERRLQREPGLDAGRAARPRRAGRRPSSRCRAPARWRSWGRVGPRYHREIGELLSGARRRRPRRRR